MLGLVALLLVSVLLLGRYHPRSGNDVLRWKPTRTIEQEVENEIDDLAQMLEAANARRRRRGEPELTEAAMRERVAADVRDANERRDRYLTREQIADEDVGQMLETVNRGRRRRGEPELTESEYRARIQAESASGAAPD
jgi:hypothetical protein